MTDLPHPASPSHVPIFVPAPGAIDWLMVMMGVFLVLFVLALGVLFLRLHMLPDHIAHRGQKLQYELVCVLGLLAMFTHQQIFWVIGLLLAIIDIPDFVTPFRRIAGSLEKLAGIPPGAGSAAADDADEARPDHNTTEH